MLMAALTGGIITTIIGGALIGVIARAIKPGADPMGWILTILFGIAGAYIGNYLLNFNSTIMSWIVAIVITIVLLFIWDMIHKRRV